MVKRIVFLSILTVLLISCQQSAKYDSVANDPMKSRIYTLDNGLKVYLSVNKDQPRIQTYIAVRVGGKNDPSSNTGLAHYLEHLMFKGTTQFGTSDYANLCSMKSNNYTKSIARKQTPQNARRFITK